MTHFRNAVIRKQLNLLSRRKAHLETVDRGSYDRSEARALGMAIEAVEKQYPERPEEPTKECFTPYIHSEHHHLLNGDRYLCKGVAEREQ